MQVLMKSFVVVSVCTQLHAPRPSSTISLCSQCRISALAKSEPGNTRGLVRKFVGRGKAIRTD